MGSIRRVLRLAMASADRDVVARGLEEEAKRIELNTNLRSRVIAIPFRFPFFTQLYTMTSRRTFSIFSALFSTSAASSSNPSSRQLKEMAVKDLVTVRIICQRNS